MLCLIGFELYSRWVPLTYSPLRVLCACFARRVLSCKPALNGWLKLKVVIIALFSYFQFLKSQCSIFHLLCRSCNSSVLLNQPSCHDAWMVQASVNPLSQKSDQSQFSPNNINTYSRTPVTRTLKGNEKQYELEGDSSYRKCYEN